MLNREELEASLLALVREVLATPGLHPVIYECFSEYLTTGVVNVRIVDENVEVALDVHNGRGMRLRLEEAVCSISAGYLDSGFRSAYALRRLLSSSLDYRKLFANGHDTQGPGTTTC